MFGGRQRQEGRLEIVITGEGRVNWALKRAGAIDLASCVLLQLPLAFLPRLVHQLLHALNGSSVVPEKPTHWRTWLNSRPTSGVQTSGRPGPRWPLPAL